MVWPEFRRVRLRLASLALLAAGALGAACAQSDVVAYEGALCLHPGDCTGDGVCPAKTCGEGDEDAGMGMGTGMGTSGSWSPVQVGDGCSDDEPSAQSFRFAVCSCSDYVSEAPLIVDGFDVQGSAERIASVGVNGSLTLGGGATIDGSLQVAGMIATGDGPELSVKGRVLDHANDACNCLPENLLDIPALVAAAEANNDDAAQGLEPRALDGFSSAQMLTLSTGTLYLSRIAGNAPLTLQIEGAVALYVSADLALEDSLTVTLAPDATLDLFLAVNAHVRGAATIGGPDTAGRVRVYVGGPGTINLETTSLIGGSLYAPTAELVTRGPLEVYGPLFLRRAAPGEELRVHYDRSAATAVACE